MTRVGMVEPVMVVRNIVRTGLALHTEHVGLTSIPVAVVRHGDILGVSLDICSTVALAVVTRTALAVEDICMVNPDVRVVGVERNTIVHAAHHTDVAELYTLAVAYQESETANSCIVTDTLDGDRHFCIGILTFNLDTLLRATYAVKVVLLHQTDEAESDRSLVDTLLVSI